MVLVVAVGERLDGPVDVYADGLAAEALAVLDLDVGRHAADVRVVDEGPEVEGVKLGAPGVGGDVLADDEARVERGAPEARAEIAVGGEVRDEADEVAGELDGPEAGERRWHPRVRQPRAHLGDVGAEFFDLDEEKGLAGVLESAGAEVGAQGRAVGQAESKAIGTDARGRPVHLGREGDTALGEGRQAPNRARGPARTGVDRPRLRTLR